MALFLLKPILWNLNGYLKPSGVRATKESFPGENGFGHEEWNNSPRLAFSEGGSRYRVFHTETVGNAPVEENEGQTFVFMTASHDGIQQLVGIAGNALFLGSEDYRSERERLSNQLKLDNLWADVWSLPLVRQLHKTETRVRKRWSADVSWIPNWVCPEEFFLWFDRPVTLDPARITGKKRLPTMFRAHLEMGRAEAQMVMDMVPVALRSSVWQALSDAIGSSSAASLTAPLKETTSDKATIRLALTNARVGQGAFRNALMNRWEGRCAVTGLSCNELLRASHVKSWADSSNRERLDPENGLLLAAHVDALFDKGLITFGDDGKMLISPRLDREDVSVMNLPVSLRHTPSPALTKYLQIHRADYFLR